MAAQECLPNNAVRDAFGAEHSVLSTLWEAISPDVVVVPFEADYKWLTKVCQSVQPTSGTGKLFWHTLGAKTIELIHQNVHVEEVRDDLETLVLDAELLEAVLGSPNPDSGRRSTRPSSLRGCGSTWEICGTSNCLSDWERSRIVMSAGCSTASTS